MVASALKSMNASAHTMADLKRFAKASPAKAEQYLQQVETQLRELGKSKEAASIRKLLTDKTGTLVERIAEHAARLGAIFPTRASDWGKVQQQRAGTVGYGYEVKPDLAVPTFLTGRIVKGKDGTAVFKTQGGQELKLNTSELRVRDTGLGIGWMAGFLGDGPMTLQGTPSEDRKSFNVEGFALNADGKFDEFTFGRVKSDGTGTISTPRGDVTIENPELLKKLKAMPRLGVILPGVPEKRGEQLVYTGNPEEFFGLARWRETQARGTGKTREAAVDMAYSVFSNKPCEMPAEFAERANHTGRLWVRGNVEMQGDTATRFKASYVSKQTDLSAPQFGPTAQNADPVQAAVMSEVV
jgi:hypothetical protein